LFLGEGNEGVVCVRFGMVTSDTDVDELLSLVLAVGREVEESAKHLDTMVEIVKKGTFKKKSKMFSPILMQFSLLLAYHEGCSLLDLQSSSLFLRGRVDSINHTNR